MRSRSLSDLTLIYCGKADFGHFVYSFLLVAGSSVCDPAKAVLFTAFQVLNRTTISLKRAQKLPQSGLSLATTGQARQAARFSAVIAGMPEQFGSGALAADGLADQGAETTLIAGRVCIVGTV
jgi:hypothetical protein